MAMLADYAQTLQRRKAYAAEPAAEAIVLPELPPGGVTLNEHESKTLLAAAGVPVTRDVVLTQNAACGTMDIGYPIVAKVLSRDIPHKSEVGGVRVGIADAAALNVAVEDLIAGARRAAPHARIDGVLACEMVPDGVEMLVGVVNDACFGPVVALGLGGVFTEVLHDVTHRVAPFGIASAHAMIGQLKGRAILEGARGKPRCDMDALARALARISHLAWQLRDRMVELDVNPLIVRPVGKGAIATVAMVVLRPAGP
jgi:acetyltransferase